VASVINLTKRKPSVINLTKQKIGMKACAAVLAQSVDTTGDQDALTRNGQEAPTPTPARPRREAQAVVQRAGASGLGAA
jgi:hypothetical protein